ncbi:MAG: S66 peptidase family protein [Fimbriimonadaceae bacterium]
MRLVTPASPIPAERVEAMAALLTDQGFVVEFGEHAFKADDYLAGSDAERAADLTAAFMDPSVDAVVCTRGGYGSARLLPYLDFPVLAAQQKLFLGFSDVTTLHLALNACGLPTLHAPMALTFHWPREPWVYESFLAALRGDLTTPAAAPKGRTLIGGRACGDVTGGCLVLVADAIGTPFAMDARGKIVLLEDVDEAPHRVDAMLTHLLNAGALEGATGVVVGEMTRSDDKVDASIGGKSWRSIVADRLAPLGLPAVIDFPFGHAPNMLTLGLGLQAELDADAGTLTYAESLCR